MEKNSAVDLPESVAVESLTSPTAAPGLVQRPVALLPMPPSRF